MSTGAMNRSAPSGAGSGDVAVPKDLGRPVGDQHLKDQVAAPANAFDVVEDKRSSKRKAHHAEIADAPVTGTENPVLNPAIPLREIEMASPSGARNAVGLYLTVRFRHPNGKRFRLHGWMALTAD